MKKFTVISFYQLGIFNRWSATKALLRAVVTHISGIRGSSSISLLYFSLQKSPTKVSLPKSRLWRKFLTRKFSKNDQNGPTSLVIVCNDEEMPLTPLYLCIPIEKNFGANIKTHNHISHKKTV